MGTKSRPHREKFARALRQIMKINRITQIELAEELGVRQQYVSQIVVGLSYPNNENFDRIMEFLRPRCSEDQCECLLDLYVAAKIGDLELPTTSPKPAHLLTDALEILFVSKFRLLTPEQQLEIMRHIEELEPDFPGKAVNPS